MADDASLICNSSDLEDGGRGVRGRRGGGGGNGCREKKRVVCQEYWTQQLAADELEHACIAHVLSMYCPLTDDTHLTKAASTSGLGGKVWPLSSHRTLPSGVALK